MLIVNQNESQVESEHRAYAKINLALFVLGKRKNGYHDISTVMTCITLSDRVLFRKGIPGLRVECPKIPGLAQEQNLAYKAALSFYRFLGEDPECEILIDKEIPDGCGMGGGSSDAALVLRVLDKIYHRNSKLDELFYLASSVGSDVPFCLGFNGDKVLWESALCTGRGEKVTPLDVRLSFYLVVVIPSFRIQTAKAYSLWDRVTGDKMELFSMADKARRIEMMLDALKSGDSREIAAHLYNDLEEVSSILRPEIAVIKGKLLEAGAFGASMTGSGSAVFGLCEDFDHAREVKDRLEYMFSKDKVGDGVVKIIVTRAGVGESP